MLKTLRENDNRYDRHFGASRGAKLSDLAGNVPKESLALRGETLSKVSVENHSIAGVKEIYSFI